MVGQGPYADMIRRRFKLQCRRLGFNRDYLELDTSRFRAPPTAGDQLDLFAR